MQLAAVFLDVSPFFVGGLPRHEVMGWVVVVHGVADLPPLLLPLLLLRRLLELADERAVVRLGRGPTFLPEQLVQKSGKIWLLQKLQSGVVPI